MPRFRVEVTTDRSIEVARALHDSGIDAVGPSSPGFSDSDGGWDVGRTVSVYLDARNAAAAGERIREIVRGDCVIVVEPASRG